jgi:hypothetical protein
MWRIIFSSLFLFVSSSFYPSLCSLFASVFHFSLFISASLTSIFMHLHRCSPPTIRPNHPPSSSILPHPQPTTSHNSYYLQGGLALDVVKMYLANSLWDEARKCADRALTAEQAAMLYEEQVCERERGERRNKERRDEARGMVW